MSAPATSWLGGLRARFTTRSGLLGLGLAFAVYFALRGLWWVHPPARPAVLAAVVALTLFATVICLFADPLAVDRSSASALTIGHRGPSMLPTWAALLAVATAAIVPTAVALAVAQANLTDPYATVYIGAIGALLTIVSIRRRPVLAWVGVAALSLGTMLWLGPQQAFTMGLTGSIMWVAVSQLTLRAMDRLGRDSLRLIELQHAAVAWERAHDARRRERRVRVQYALQVAGPILERIIEQDGALDDDERVLARVAEGALRDELRGGALLDDRVRAAMNTARRRGSHVTLFDEGALVGVDADQLSRIRRELVRTIAAADADRIIVRTARDERIAVTVVGRSDGGDAEDDVQLWHEILRSDRPEQPTGQ